MQQTRPVRVAVVGAGTFVRDAYLPALRLAAAQLEVAVVYSRSQASSQALLEQVQGFAPGAEALHGDAGFTQLLEGRSPAVDAALVALPPQAQTAAVHALLRAGVPVLSEKPAAPTLAEAQGLLAAAPQDVAGAAGEAGTAGEGRGGMWCVAENYRSMEAFRRLSSALSRGEVGAVARLDMAVDLAMTPDNKYYASAWRRDSAGMPGAYLCEGGVHFVAALRMAARAAGFGEAARVSAVSRSLKEDLPSPDTLVGTVFFSEEGAAASFSMTMAAAVMRVGLTAVGTKGTMEVVRGGAGVQGPAFRLTRQPAPEGAPAQEECPGSGVEEELRAFARLVAARLAGAEPSGEGRGQVEAEEDAFSVSAEEAVRDLALVTALLESAGAGGRLVEVEAPATSAATWGGQRGA